MKSNATIQVLILLFLGIVGIIIGSLTVAATWGLLFPDYDETSKSAALVSQAILTTTTFIIPSIIYILICPPRSSEMFSMRLDAHPVTLCILSGSAMILALPLINQTAVWNQAMHLPDFLNGIETWMQESERAANELTNKLLVMHNSRDFITNIFIIALLPAIGEELFFHGALQGTLTSHTATNKHVVVWGIAIFFSAAHLQFYGFVPRIILGAILGYIFLWTRSIWFPIVAHFANNALVVIATYIISKADPQFMQEATTDAYSATTQIDTFGINNIIAFFISVILCIGALLCIKSISRRH